MNPLSHIKNLLLLLTCALCWGPSYLFIKIALPSIPPVTLALWRVAVGALILYVICLFQKHKLTNWKHLWKHYAVMGITLNALPFSLVCLGELYISSSLTGILNGLTLIFTAIISHFFGAHDTLTKNKILGICSGILGLGVIYFPLISANLVGIEVGALMVVIACLSYGIGTVYARSHLPKAPGIVALTTQLIISTIVLFPLAMIFERPYALPMPPLGPILGALALGVIGTALGFFCYFKAIQKLGATSASFATLLIPLIAMVLGVLFLHEKLTWNLYLGTFLILLGAVSVNPMFNKKL